MEMECLASIELPCHARSTLQQTQVVLHPSNIYSPDKTEVYIIVFFNLPSQSDIDDILYTVKFLDIVMDNLNVPERFTMSLWAAITK